MSALLVWLDARSRGDRVILRFENLDHTRCQPALLDGLRRDLSWLGLDWDAVLVQTELAEQHHAALDSLAAAGRLYPCQCTRKDRRAAGRPAPDGGFAYANTCRDRPLPAGGWRAAGAPVRLRLPDDAVSLVDDGGLDLSQVPARDLGDPVVVRRDGVIAYHLVVVVDDAASGVTRVVRGRDLAAATATQVLIQRCLGLRTPSYRHHFLLLEPRGGKLAKLHGSVGAPALRAVYGPEQLCGVLAAAAGILDAPHACRPQDLFASFQWPRVRERDLVMMWTGDALHTGEPGRIGE